MQLRIGARGLDLPGETRRGIERRLRLAIGRHVARIAVARLTLSPGGSTDGGARCRIHVRFRDGSKRVVEDRAPDPMAAATRALWRLEHRLEGSQAPPSGRVA